MKPASFRYVAASDVADAVALLTEHGDTAKLLAGGQSLVPMMNLRLSRPGVLIDLNRMPQRNTIAVEDGLLRVGLLVRQKEAEHSPIVLAQIPLLAEAIAEIGHAQIRSRGTLVGSCCHADPAAETPAVLLALDGSVRVQGPQGAREIAASDFFLGYFQTALAPDEVATDLLFPIPAQGTGSAFLEFARRHGDFALVAVAALVHLDAEGAVQGAALSLAGVGPSPLRATGAEQFLIGRRAEPAVLLEAARIAAQGIEPTDDVQASAAYRTQLAQTLVERALLIAASRAAREVA
ncbi:MAG: xanthine dehydrogenase family protein subunit M [Thermaerobacter sp.]|nr:xanthine dehydrogenase family protein subunit M [Thermaerobacter sp.]